MSERRWSWRIVSGAFVKVFSNLIVSSVTNSSREWPYGSWFRQADLDANTGMRRNQMGVSRAADRGLWVRDWLNSSVQQNEMGVDTGDNSIATTFTQAHPLSGGAVGTSYPIMPTVVVHAGSGQQWLDGRVAPINTVRSCSMDPANSTAANGVAAGIFMASSGTSPFMVSVSLAAIQTVQTTGVTNDEVINTIVQSGNGVPQARAHGGTW